MLFAKHLDHQGQVPAHDADAFLKIRLGQQPVPAQIMGGVQEYPRIVKCARAQCSRPRSPFLRTSFARPAAW